MEQKLAEYRLKKLKGKKDAPIEQSVSKRNISQTTKNEERRSPQIPAPIPAQPQRVVPMLNSDNDSASLLSQQDPEKDDVINIAPKSKYDRYLYLASVLLQFLLWSLLMVIFVKLEFGAVFFVISLLYILWSTLRRRPKKAGELSAYSVFNPNCERIDGTLTAEQFEREIRFQT